MACTSDKCLGDDGYKEGEKLRTDAVKYAANWMLAQSLVMALLNANDLKNNYKKQRDIANRTTKIAEEQQNHLVKVFWPRELQFLAEFTEPEDLDTIEEMGRRYAGRLVSTIADKFAKELHRVKCSAPRYCTSYKEKALQDVMLMRSEAMANGRVLGRLIAFAETQERKARDDKRRQQAIGLKGSLMNEAARLYASAGAAVAEAGTGIAERLQQSFERFGFGWSMRQNAGSESQFASVLQQRNPANRAPFTPYGMQPINLADNSYSLGPVRQISGMGTMSGDPFSSIDASRFSVNSTGQSTSSLLGLGTQGQSGLFYNMQAEQPNQAYVGNRDMVRWGKHTYTDSDGDTVTIDMSDFKVDFADQYDPGSKP